MNQFTPINPPRATYEDVLNAPPHLVAEVIEGRLSLMPRPKTQHGEAQDVLLMRLKSRFQFGDDASGGWWIKSEPEIHLGEDILVPDLAGWRRARLPVFPRAAYVSDAPDWVCEILSASTASMDKGAKARIYAREGIAHYWLIDPEARTLEARALENGAWRIIGQWRDKAPVKAPPFEAVTLELNELWMPEDPQ